jgi:SAM-dependent methyltransferase
VTPQPVAAVNRPVRLDDVADLITPMAVRVAATLRLADHLDAGVGNVADLAYLTRTHPGALGVLVRHLVAAGVLAESDGVISLTRLGKQLRVAQAFLDVERSVGRSELSLVHLLESVRTGRPAYDVLFGRSFWEDLADRPDLKATFDDMTDRHLQNELAPLMAAHDWSTARHVADLGAGNGALLVHLLRTFPHLRGSILDLPGNTPVAERNLAAAGVADRSQVVAGDFFRPLTHLGADTFVLSSVLHDWDDESAAAILRRVAEAVGTGGRLLVVDSFIEDGTDDTRMDLRMLALFGGRQRTVAQMQEIAAGAGLGAVGATRLRKKWLLVFGPGPNPKPE